MDIQAKDLKDATNKREGTRHRAGKTRSISPTSTTIDQLLSVFAPPKPRPCGTSIPAQSQVQIDPTTISTNPTRPNPSSFVAIAHQQQQQSQPQKQKQQKQKKTPHLNTLLNNELYKTEMCRSFEETGSCRYGSRCQFAHGIHDLRVVERHPRYKTDICKTFIEKGFCAYGKRCRFSHSAVHENIVDTVFHGDEEENANQYLYGGMNYQSNHYMAPSSDEEYPSCAQQTHSSNHSSQHSPVFQHANPAEDPQMNSLLGSLSLDHGSTQSQDSNAYLCNHQYQPASSCLAFALPAPFQDLLPLPMIPESSDLAQLHSSPLAEPIKKAPRDSAWFGIEAFDEFDHDHSYGSEHSFGHDSDIETRSQDLSLSPTDMRYGQLNSCRPATQRRLPIFEKIAH
eukprot:TRINITY_DN528_c1_g2_i1.p1 TRINITY_DN528_c1_g2~~TRINITY_DN528_c1_g2_i1.p1  ORF type:complete len:397 (-),score=71.92 TRINITY_DN528_c1_g2_i1:346-1536(-)